MRHSWVSLFSHITDKAETGLPYQCALILNRWRLRQTFLFCLAAQIQITNLEGLIVQLTTLLMPFSKFNTKYDYLLFIRLGKGSGMRMLGSTYTYKNYVRISSVSSHLRQGFWAQKHFPVLLDRNMLSTVKQLNYYYLKTIYTDP